MSVAIPIVAPAAGRAVFVGELPVHGVGVILDHGAGVYSGYWHMSQTTLESGTLLQRGDVLGQIGDSGLAVGPHLHWEVICMGKTWTRCSGCLRGCTCQRDRRRRLRW